MDLSDVSQLHREHEDHDEGRLFIRLRGDRQHQSRRRDRDQLSPLSLSGAIIMASVAKPEPM